jgi:3-oxoacyl-[acyl-carrier-protein] synthase II
MWRCNPRNFFHPLPLARHRTHGMLGQGKVRREVVVTGLGVASAAGCDVAAFWERVRTGTSAVRHAVARSERAPAALYEAGVDDGELDNVASALGVRSTERVVRLGSVACRQAWHDAGLPLPAGAELGAHAGLILGSGLGGIQFQEEQMWRVLRAHDDRIHPHTVPRVSTTAILTEVSQALALRGPGFVISSACASSAHALGQAMRTIQCGDADVMVAGGAEAPLTHFSMTAFSLLGVLAKAPGAPGAACKPFDEKRDGFVLGEGAGALVLESLEHATARGARIYARLSGYGQSLGGYHAVHARPDGEDAAAAMRAAVWDAGRTPDQIGYVNAHGTGTRENDVAEARAMHLVFEAAVQRVPISSIKPIIGHTIGAAGALEALACVKAVASGVVPPNANLSSPDPACALRVITVPTAFEAEGGARIALSNSFGFGNVNVSLLFERGTP